jgi:hypothetical protein
LIEEPTMSTVTSQNGIRDHMEVVCSRGMHVGTVDHVRGDQIKLTRRDSDDGKHHLIPTSLVASVDDKVHLSRPCDEVKKIWISE